MSTILWASLAIAAGAFVGGGLRGILRHHPGGRAGTFTANMTACLVLGAALGIGPGGAGLWQFALATGFSGALSTWSTLAGELGALLRERSWRQLTGYLVLTLGGGLLLGWIGWESGALFQ